MCVKSPQFLSISHCLIKKENTDTESKVMGCQPKASNIDINRNF